MMIAETQVKRATTPAEAAQAEGEFRAGGTDVGARRYLGISQGPLVDIRSLQGCQKIRTEQDGSTTIGAMVTLQALADHPLIGERYPGLAQVAGDVATPQIRQVATLGGSLLQQTRCAYFRNRNFNCLKRGGEGCPARGGHHDDGVIFDLGPCCHPHPSTTALALLAYEALYVTHQGEPRPLAELYGDGADPTADHTLAAGELLTQVILLAPEQNVRAFYFRSTSRALAEWPIVESIALLRTTDGRFDFARVAVGGVATIPLRLPAVEGALAGKPATGETLRGAARRAAERANPLPGAAYKVDFLIGTVLEALEGAAALDGVT